MQLLAECRARARQVIGPAIGVCVVSYFAYHAVNGDRGLIAWQALEQEVAEACAALAELRERRTMLEHRVRLLHPRTVDPDMLDESARRIRGYGRPDDIVIIYDREAMR